MPGNFAPVPRDLGDVVHFFTAVGAPGTYLLDVALAEQWRVLAVTCVLATGVSVGNRVVQAGYSLDAGNVFLSGNAVNQAASLTWTYTFYLNAPVSTAVSNNRVLSDLPEATIGPGLVPKFWIVVTGAFVGDNLNNIALTYQRWRIT